MRSLSFASSAAASIAVLLLLGGCGKEEPDPRTQAPTVRIVRVQPAQAAERGFTGLIAARVQSNLGFRVGGKLSERLVDAGQIVHQGQPLMRIDRTDYQHAIAVQAANLAAAKARLDQATADEARYAGLVEAGAISKSTQDQIKAAADSARAQYAAADAQLRVAKDEGDYATLLADADGTVVDTLAEPGQVVAAGQVVVRLAHAGQREAVVGLPETMRPALGTEAAAALFGAEGRGKARLRQLSDSADPQTRTFEARFVLDGAAANAPLGATVTLYLADQAQAGVSVPLGALDDEGKGPGVWVLDEGASTVSYRPVAIAALSAESAVLAEGPAAGTAIVGLGGHLLHQGQSVRVAVQEARK
jgi:RND family efflux transporter MFP subunit